MKVPKPISHLLNRIPHQHIALLACVVFVVGLLAGRAIMSIGMMLLLANALINKDIGLITSQFFKSKAALLLTGLFFLYALSFFWSDNHPYFASRLQLMGPFWVLPFAFQSVKWKQHYFDYVVMLFIAVCVAGACWSLFQYLSDKNAIDAAYGVSKSMPTPFQLDHIRFGVAVVVGISFCFQLFKQKKRAKWLWLLCAFFLIVYLHLLASKTALLSLYLIILYEVAALIIKKKKRLLGASLLFLLMALPVVAYYTSASFNNKVWYSVYSFYELSNDTAQTNVSDEGRIVSYKTAFKVYKENLLLGVGIGDGRDAMEKAYENNGVQTERILYPHNQFLYIALVLGSLGLLYFLFCGFYLFKKYFRRSDWMASFLLIFIVPFMVEAFLNTQYGIAIFLFFFLLLERRGSLHLK